MELPDSPASPPLGEAVPAPAADLAPDAPLSISVPPDNGGTLVQPALSDTTASPLPPSRPATRAPQPPDAAALDNARRGIWVMNENHDGWVLLGADRKPVMRKDRSRVSFRFRDAARLAQELAASPDDLSPGVSAKGGVDPVPLAPLDSGYNRDWNPQAQKSFLADITKACRLLAYQYVQFTEPQEAVRRAVSDILQNPTYVKEGQMNAWVPGKYDAEAVKTVAATLHRRAVGPEQLMQGDANTLEETSSNGSSPIDLASRSMRQDKHGFGQDIMKTDAISGSQTRDADGQLSKAPTSHAFAKSGFNNQQIDNRFDRERWDSLGKVDERSNSITFITSSDTIAVEASSIASPPTNQFRFSVFVAPLDDNDSPQDSLATTRWFEPTQHSSGFTGVSYKMIKGQRVIQANAPGGKKYKWTIVLPEQASGHDNVVSNSNMLEVFKPK